MQDCWRRLLVELAVTIYLYISFFFKWNRFLLSHLQFFNYPMYLDNCIRNRNSCFHLTLPPYINLSPPPSTSFLHTKRLSIPAHLRAFPAGLFSSPLFSSYPIQPFHSIQLLAVHHSSFTKSSLWKHVLLSRAGVTMTGSRECDNNARDIHLNN